MSSGQGKLPSNSIKVVPGRSKLRVESSNPVARGNPVPRPSKVKLIPPEEAIQLHSGVSQAHVPPASVSSRPYKPARPTFQSSRPNRPGHSTFEPSRLNPARPTFESQRREHARPTFESQRPEPALATFESQRPNPIRATFESQTPKPARLTTFEGSRPVPAGRTPEALRHVPARTTCELQRLEHVRATFESQAPNPARATLEGSRTVLAGRTVEGPRHVPARPTSKPPRPVPARPTSDPPRRVPAHPAPGFRKEIVCGLRAASSVNATTVRRRTNQRSLHQPRTVQLPPTSSALQIRSEVQQQARHTIEVSGEAVVEVDDKAKDHDSKETCRSASLERISELRLYRPALLPTWKGRIVDSAMFPEFDCEFWANPASNIRKTALKLSKAMPRLLRVELVPLGHILNDVFDRIPKVSDVELYFFSVEKETERSKREHAHLFGAMATRNAMIKAHTNGKELLIFSSKVLDKTSQFFLKNQTKTENYLWGFFLRNKKSQPHALDDGNAVDMEIDTEDPAPRLTLQPVAAESQNTSSSSQGKGNEEVSLPPVFEKIWTPPS